MATKDPRDFNLGDVIKNSSGTPYSGSPVVAVKALADAQTQVTFENGEVVEFFNGVQHELEE